MVEGDTLSFRWTLLCLDSPIPLIEVGRYGTIAPLES
jgi:hypothetical protein